MRMFITALVCLHLLAPIAVWSQAVVKTPLSYSLQEYGIVLDTALLGGQASDIAILIMRIIMNMDELECMRPDTNNGDRPEICAGINNDIQNHPHGLARQHRPERGAPWLRKISRSR